MRKDKGRSPSEDLVSITVAARMLRLSVRTLHRMCTKGVLLPVYKSRGGPKHFPVQEIGALAEVLGKKLSLADVTALALRALVTAKANERRIEDLLRVVGLKRSVLGTSPEDVTCLYERTVQLLQIPRQPTLDELEEWAGIFYAIDETYLSLVEHETACVEPWKAFLDAANKLTNDRPYAFFDAVPTLRSAYDYLEAARRNLRIVSYMYCRARQGVETTNRIFGDMKIPDQILSVMFSS